MKNLLVTIGNKELPDSFSKNLEHTLIIHTKVEDSSLTKSVASLYSPGLTKCNLEFEAKQLFERVIFVNTNFFTRDTDISKFFKLKMNNFTLYSLNYDVKFINHKNLIFPSTKIWACSSLTFNILSNLKENHFDRTSLYRYVQDSGEEIGEDHEFFNILGGFMIKIQGL
jgi:hypothetical protein